MHRGHGRVRRHRAVLIAKKRVEIAELRAVPALHEHEFLGRQDQRQIRVRHRRVIVVTIDVPDRQVEHVAEDLRLGLLTSGLQILDHQRMQAQTPSGLLEDFAAGVPQERPRARADGGITAR